MLSAAGKIKTGRETREGRETVSSAGRRQEPTGPLPTGPLPTPGMAAPSEEEEGEGLSPSRPGHPGQVRATGGNREGEGTAGPEHHGSWGGRGARPRVPTAARLHQRVPPVTWGWGQSPAHRGVTAASVAPVPSNPSPFAARTCPDYHKYSQIRWRAGQRPGSPSAATGDTGALVCGLPGHPPHPGRPPPHQASPPPLTPPPLAPAAPLPPPSSAPERAAALPRCFSQFMVIPAAALPKTQ